MKELMARVKYYEDTGDGKDGFAIEISTDKGETWGLDTCYFCHRREGAKESEEADYIHFSALKKLLQCINLGYEIIPN